MELAPEIIALLTLAAVLSGFIDAVAGGGGLITVPALLSVGLPPLNTLATNKLQSLFGTSFAFSRYHRAGLVNVKSARATVGLVFIGAVIGCLAVQAIDPSLLSLIVPGLLLLVTGYIIFSPRMTDADAQQRLSQRGYGPIGGLIGAYDGFFGPGTGMFFTTSLVGLRGLGLTRATALTKLFNLTSNVASVLVFALGGHIYWLLGLCMAAGAMTGAWIGSHFAMRFGAKLIRPMLVVISLALSGRLLWQAFG
jgi:uncharacterized protein